MNTLPFNGNHPSVYGAVHLGYMFVESPHLSDWKRLAADGIGMAVAAESPDLIALRTDAHARRLIVSKKSREDVTLGWEVDGPAALQIILQRLSARRISIEEIAGDEAATRGVKRLWRFIGPKRQCFELFTEPVTETNEPKVRTTGFVTGERGLGHVAITSRKPQAMVAFWREIFDAKVSDYIEDRISGVNLRITFLRVNSRHHSIAIAGTKGLAMDPFTTKIQHVEMQVETLDDVSTAFTRCRELGFKIAMSVGQHTNDRDVSFYVVTPSGFYFELGWSSSEAESENWPVVVHDGISVWGHKPLDQTIGDQLAQMRNGITSLFQKEYMPF
jgi:2,3-dihydroxybiphenyl 1,2-dioxygenase